MELLKSEAGNEQLAFSDTSTRKGMLSVQRSIQAWSATIPHKAQKTVRRLLALCLSMLLLFQDFLVSDAPAIDSLAFVN